jgi:MSHA biogenesis protein MshJ
MKQSWQKISTRIDALSLRERAILFATAAALLIFLVFFFFLNPSYARQKQMLDDMARQQDRIAAVDAELVRTMEAHTLDPDAAERARLARMVADTQALKATLTAMQQGMVPAERMNGVLEQILRAHRGLRLKSLRTLGEGAAEPAGAVVAVPAAGAAVAPVVAAPVQLLHRHGVELVVQGSYPDMVAYMGALEGMQGQLFWGRASLSADTWPEATLTLTLYTINLDQKWLKL